ncbi:MAG TPA: hypothetical protein DCL44_11560 [Elusimicrobia bacterium]|nr:hypothetical protein [Elusimicrobiota bacterium]
MEKKESLFAGLTPSPVSAPGSAQAKPESDARVAPLEVSVRALQAEIVALKQAAARPNPPAPPASPQNDKELLSRLEKAENGFSELKTTLSELQSQMKERQATLVSKEEIETVKVKLADTCGVFETIKRAVSEYTSEFSGIERECRKSLGEMQGYVKNMDQKLVAEKIDDHLKDSVSRLSSKMADVERAVHAGLSDLSSRLMTDEVFYRKIFSEAEERLRKGLEPDIQSINGQLKVLTSKVNWLMDEYSIVMERKMRALEAKYSAFDIISARMDNISEALRAEKADAEKRKF